MAQYIYAVKTIKGLIDVSNTERGAKNYATRHGYDWIVRRDVMRGNIESIAIKENGKWEPFSF